MANIIRKDGKLSVYGFMCGYIQTKLIGEHRVELYLDGVWHLKSFCKDKRISWECFEELKEARKEYSKAIRKVGA